MSEPHVVIIILNTNRRHDTLACLASLGRSTYNNHTLIVLDNGSSDGSVEAIRSSFETVQIVELAENRGYAGNNNVGINIALAQQADWVFVLNEDTVIDPNCLRELIRVAESDSTIGAVGPTVYHFDEPQVIQSAGGLMDRWWFHTHRGQNECDVGQYVQPTVVDWVSGCALLIRSDVIRKVGSLDDRYFIYAEEVDWCLRIRWAGYRLMHVPSAKVWHKGVKRNYKPSPQVTYYMARNHLLLLKKHRAGPGAQAMAWLRMGRTLASWTLRPKWRHLRAHRNALFRALLDASLARWGECEASFT